MSSAQVGKRMDDLIAEYKRTRKLLRALYTLSTVKSDREQIKSMLNDCEWAMEWMETGSYPRRRRAINRLSYIQRTIFMEPAVLEVIANRNKRDTDQTSVTPEQRGRIDRALDQLTAQEHNCFVTVYGQGLSFAEAAEVLQLSKSSVGTYISRAKRKMTGGAEIDHV